MRRHTRQRLAQQELEAARQAAYDDAHSLATELSAGPPRDHIDPTPAGILLQPDETAYRTFDAKISVLQQGQWTPAAPVGVLLTDQRLLCRYPDAHLISLWWGGLTGIEPHPDQDHIILDYADGAPVVIEGMLAAAFTCSGAACAGSH